jgi:signal transduction histidine kinase
MESSMPFSDEVVITLDKRTVFERTVRFDHKSSVVGSIMHFRDVTASRDVDRMKTEFLSTAAHELRTPMANIFGYTELLIKAQFDKQKQDELLNIIFNQTRRLSAILDDLLDLARIEARAGEAFKFDFHDVAQLVSDSIREQEIELSKHKLTVSIEQDIGQIWCDAEKLMQVIENILSNAAKYSEDNTDIELAAISAGDGQRDGVEIKVTDSGAGMSEADRNRIFERFYRADTTGKIPGTGLGMSIVKEIVSHHQGLIDILSKPGEGTTVKVWIPRTPTTKTITVPDIA